MVVTVVPDGNCMDPLHIHLRGTAKEIGVQHGHLLHDQILRQIKFYEGMFKSRSKLTWEKVLDVARSFEPVLWREAPDLVQEMAGIAEGLQEPEVTLLDIIALNCRSEIALGKWSDGCTAVGFNTGTPPKQFLGQNWDWDEKMRDNIAIISIEKRGKPKIWMVSEAGIIGKIGFNSSSIGVCLNAIRAKLTDTSLLPIHLLLRLVLESDSMAMAINRLYSIGGCATSGHMLIADPTGSKGVEISPKGIFILEENEKRIISHSNHFIKNHRVDEPKWLDDSFFRIKRMQDISSKLVEEKSHSELTLEEMRNLFRDRANAPTAICRSKGADGIVSLFNIVMRLEKGNPVAEVVLNIGTKEEKSVFKMPY